jgi:mRNA deadenylase 3'-5' endonuclease subunit Ccr4
MGNIVGKLESSSGFYNELTKNLFGDSEEGLIKWALDNEEKHPQYTMFCHGFHNNLDYIFYSPQTMRVKRLLEIPSLHEISQETDLPSKLFPSDHLRM